MEDNLKYKTARSVKWNVIDRISSQALYAVTGIVLARLLSPADFGLVGAALIFQAFASIIIDSGFSFALIQRKSPTRLDYSTVLWFNIMVATVLYAGLYFAAPLIADCFQHDRRLIPLSRVMFITMIINATSIVQVNQLTKQMHIRPVTLANVASLAVGGAVGIALALMGYGAWAIVWQAIVNSGVKSALLWLTSHWLPLWRFSWTALRSFFAVGSGMMLTSFLNTVFLNIFAFFIGNQNGMSQLGYYTQSDKWSKMGVTSISQTITSSFLPPLSAVQDDLPRFRRLCSKMNRTTAYVLFPVLIGLIIMAEPIFHLLFGQKWDLSIVLFQLLLVRGIFQVLTGLSTNYMLALGRTRAIVAMEVMRDVMSLGALIATLPYLHLSTASDGVMGIRIMIYGQIAATVVSWATTLVCSCRLAQSSPWSSIVDCLPYLAVTAAISPLLIAIGRLPWAPIAILAAQSAIGLALYLVCNHLLKSRVQRDAIALIINKMR